VLIFLASHLLNHASAVFTHEFNRAMMNAFRKWYRSDVVQPLLDTEVHFAYMPSLLPRQVGWNLSARAIPSSSAFHETGAGRLLH
jgi:hypothetical protein